MWIARCVFALALYLAFILLLGRFFAVCAAADFVAEANEGAEKAAETKS